MTQGSPPDPASHSSPTRERLLREAAELFNSKGYAATSVGEIVAAAGVTKPMLYYHFKSKEGLYLQIMAGGLAAFRALVADALDATGGSATNRIAGLCGAVIERALGNLSVVRLARVSHYAPPSGAPAFDAREFHRTIRSALEELVDRGVRAGEFLPVARENLVWAVIGLLSACIDSNLGEPAAALTPQGFREALDLVIAGVTPASQRNEGAS